MKLAAYLTREKLSQTEFADRTGLTKGTVSLLCNGKVWPSLDTVNRIAAATRSEVTASDFVVRRRRRRRTLEAAE